MGEDKIAEECYTVIDNDAFMQINPTKAKETFGILSFTAEYLHSEVDISYYNNPLTVFFSKLKEDASQNVSHANILDNITGGEKPTITCSIAYGGIYGRI